MQVVGWMAIRNNIVEMAIILLAINDGNNIVEIRKRNRKNVGKK